jgi:hypothetical protein
MTSMAPAATPTVAPGQHEVLPYYDGGAQVYRRGDPSHGKSDVCSWTAAIIDAERQDTLSKALTSLGHLSWCKTHSRERFTTAKIAHKKNATVNAAKGRRNISITPRSCASPQSVKTRIVAMRRKRLLAPAIYETTLEDGGLGRGRVVPPEDQVLIVALIEPTLKHANTPGRAEVLSGTACCELPQCWLRMRSQAHLGSQSPGLPEQQSRYSLDAGPSACVRTHGRVGSKSSGGHWF